MPEGGDRIAAVHGQTNRLAYPEMVPPATSSILLLRDVQVLGAGRTDVTIEDGAIRIGIRHTEGALPSIAGNGAALLPGLHDHHIHVLAAAAAMTSVPCGPPDVRDERGLMAGLRAARAHLGWIRGIGYDEAVAGHLDRRRLDLICPSVPTRIQHRSGSLWVVNSAAIRELGLSEVHLDGVERDAAGRPTGRLWRMDAWLRERLGGQVPNGVDDLSAELAARGVTGVTDATPDLSAEAVQATRAAGFVQSLTSLGLEGSLEGHLGPRKIVVTDHALPSFDELALLVSEARPRAVALHCVTRAALVLVLAVLESLGTREGDRVEHAAVCPPELASWMARLGISVVTQPSLVARRGDEYLDRVDAEDQPHLWPYASLLEAGVRVGCSSDAPYGDHDPWLSIAAAVDRRAPSGRTVTIGERVPAAVALAGYLSPAHDPGGAARELRTGAGADLCLLDRPLDRALEDPADVRVLLTMVGGRIVHRDPSIPEP